MGVGLEEVSDDEIIASTAEYICDIADVEIDEIDDIIDLYIVVFVKYDIDGDEYNLAIASDAQFEGPRGAEDWQDGDEDMTRAADWDNPVDITKA